MDSAGNKIVYLSSTSTTWENYFTGCYFSSSIIQDFQLRDQILVVTSTDKGLRLGHAIRFGLNDGSALSFSQVAPPSSTDIQYFSDYLYNFIRAVSHSFVWLTMTSHKTEFLSYIASN